MEIRNKGEENGPARSSRECSGMGRRCKNPQRVGHTKAFFGIKARPPARLNQNLLSTRFPLDFLYFYWVEFLDLVFI